MADKKTPAEQRAETIRLRNEMIAKFESLREPKSKKQHLDEAQMIMYDAWESSPARAVKLAKMALEHASDCADAYLLLANLEARTTRDRIDLIDRAIKAGRRALGKKGFHDYAGHFWGELDTRPFMRAMAAMADIRWEIGEGDTAIAIWREMLELNPNDNQGVRYQLMSCLLELKRNDEAAALLKSYKDDAAAAWAYAAALLAFRKEGDTPLARRKFAAARMQNPYVLPYLLGAEKIPRRLPEYIAFGDETEAVVYAAANIVGWAKTPGALEWLAGQTKQGG